MKLAINFLIFCVVLFVYIHVYNHIKTSSYLEVYEIENLSKDKFEDLNNLKQPLLLNNYTLENSITVDYLTSNYPTFDLNLYNKQSDTFLKIKMEEFESIITSDDSNNYISYNNKEFLDETTLEKVLSSNDSFFRPYNICNKSYDIIMGKKNSSSKLKYSINSRNILYLSSGQIEVTLCPPKYYKNLHVKKNYELLDFYSVIDINNIQPIYKNDYHKVKFLRVLLNANQVLIIPPYWFYSIKFLEKNTIVFFNSYRTFTSTIAIIPDLFIQMLQQNNLKLNMIKKIDTNSESILHQNDTDYEREYETETVKNENVITENVKHKK
uniref:Cupin-like domain-containing protein n=1 Tax=viral metagenome TaxID=1070528 RepID=A0A6C0H509_9ZZZZ